MRPVIARRDCTEDHCRKLKKLILRRGSLSLFFFSLESQHTIGYGTRYMTEVCPPAFVILCVQLIVGVLLQTMLAGVVVAKVLRPKKRKQVRLWNCMPEVFLYQRMSKTSMSPLTTFIEPLRIQ